MELSVDRSCVARFCRWAVGDQTVMGCWGGHRFEIGLDASTPRRPFRVCLCVYCAVSHRSGLIIDRSRPPSIHSPSYIPTHTRDAHSKMEAKDDGGAVGAAAPARHEGEEEPMVAFSKAHYPDGAFYKRCCLFMGRL